MDFSAAFLPDSESSRRLSFGGITGGAGGGVSSNASSASRITYLPDGQVFINGTHQADSVYATKTSSGRLSIYFAGKETKEFPFANVSLIHFRGRMGDDLFDNFTTIPSLVYGDEGNDSLIGGLADDRIFGGVGNDAIYARSGNDLVYGDAGDDLVHAGPGNDYVFGLDGNDRIHGEEGTDRLFGGNGDDLLAGGWNIDFLYGEAGSDALLGGPSATDPDRLEGGTGQDRMLLRPGSVITQGESHDVSVVFSNFTSSWNETEILVIDRGIRKLQIATGNNRLLTDYYTGKTLNLVKHASLPGGATAQNVLWFTTRNGQVISKTREIQFADWNEASEPHNGALEISIMHEVSHNFDSPEELSANPWLRPYDFSRFLEFSAWRSTNPNSSSFRRSGDGLWWYVSWAQFYRSYSTINPYEDWATVWELAMADNASQPPGTSNLGLKLAHVRSLIQRLRT